MFFLGEEYAQTLRRAELEWLRRLIAEVKDGSLDGMVGGLHASLDQILWVLNGYSVLYAVLLLAVFVWTQRRQQGGKPLLPFAVFRDRNYTVVTLVLAAMGFSML